MRVKRGLLLLLLSLSKKSGVPLVMNDEKIYMIYFLSKLKFLKWVLFIFYHFPSGTANCRDLGTQPPPGLCRTIPDR